MPASGLQAAPCVYGGKESHSHLGTLYVLRHTYNFLSVSSAERVLVMDGRHRALAKGFKGWCRRTQYQWHLPRNGP